MDYQQQTFERMIHLPIETLCVQYEGVSGFIVPYRNGLRRRPIGAIQEHDDQIFAAMKFRIREAPLDFLVGLTCIPKHSRDPDIVPDVCMTMYELARREIHRRSLENFVYKSYKQSSVNPTFIGYPRKPNH